MAKIIELNTIIDSKGSLTVIEKLLPFEIKRVFYIYNVNDISIRGMHRHHNTIQAAIAINGSCEIYNQLPKSGLTERFLLNQPTECLIIYPEDFHWMKKFSKNCVLLVLASEFYDPSDYILEPYYQLK